MGSACRGVAVGLLALLALPALAQDRAVQLRPVLREEAVTGFGIDPSGPLGLFFLGLVIFSACVGVLHLNALHAWRGRDRRQLEEINSLQERLERAETLMAAERQVVIVFRGDETEATVEGDLAFLTDAAIPRRVLGFGAWATPADAQRLDQLVKRLKERGEGFSLAMEALNGRRIEVTGRAVAGRAVVRLRDVDGEIKLRQESEEAFRRLATQVGALHAVLDRIPQPIWLRYGDGRLAWVNSAYASAVDGRHANEVVERGTELLDKAVRERVAQATTLDQPFCGRIQAIVAGRRATLDVTNVATDLGSGGIAVEASAIEAGERMLEAQIAQHARTLHLLPVAVAIFDHRRVLKFHNAAYARLWGLPEDYLKTGPSDGEILDRLRAQRMLPEQADFRGWKQQLLDGYSRLDTLEHEWHLPDRRVLRVVTSPEKDGGITYLYFDMTEKLSLESEYNAVSRVRNETLDSLHEGVAVFGTDGRLKLANTAFGKIWRLAPEALAGEPHVEQLVQRLSIADDKRLWSDFRERVTSVSEARIAENRRVRRADGSVIDIVITPLPDGATLFTFGDVTAAVNEEMMQRERHEALESAYRLKDRLIQNVTFELRNPLQIVSGFVAMLNDERTAGPLTPRQSDYARAAKRSSDSLLMMMDDVFDLASLDAGTLELRRKPVKPAATIAEVSTLLADVATERKVDVRVMADPNLSIHCDEDRLRRIIFHLMSNAIGFSGEGQSVEVTLREDFGDALLEVRDRGRGIPKDKLDRVFERFESHTEGSRHSGMGLGLPVVKALVDLHGGEVTINSAEGRGTTVTCRFPVIAAGSGQRAA
jgi:signal transduction histidine kinase